MRVWKLEGTSVKLSKINKLRTKWEVCQRSTLTVISSRAHRTNPAENTNVSFQILNFVVKPSILLYNASIFLCHCLVVIGLQSNEASLSTYNILHAKQNSCRKLATDKTAFWLRKLLSFKVVKECWCIKIQPQDNRRQNWLLAKKSSNIISFAMGNAVNVIVQNRPLLAEFSIPLAAGCACLAVASIIAADSWYQSPDRQAWLSELVPSLSFAPALGVLSLSYLYKGIMRHFTQDVQVSHRAWSWHVYTSCNGNT